jgi:flagellar basal-body rod modification protein FlgD
VIDPSLAASAALSAVNLLSSATDSTPATTPPKKGDDVDQADFMKLLVAQLANQDPLNPLDSANFSAQLAQFSSLQQLTQINQHLADQAKPTAGGAFDAVSFLGRDVQAASDDVTVTSGVASGLDYQLQTAGVVEAKVLDEGGREVASLVLGTQAAGAHHFDLASIPGAPHLGDGHYHVQLSTPAGTGTSTAIVTTVTGRVSGVDLAASPPVLLVDGRRVALADVREIHEHTAAESAA